MPEEHFLLYSMSVYRGSTLRYLEEGGEWILHSYPVSLSYNQAIDSTKPGSSVFCRAHFSGSLSQHAHSRTRCLLTFRFSLVWFFIRPCILSLRGCGESGMICLYRNIRSLSASYVVPAELLHICHSRHRLETYPSPQQLFELHNISSIFELRNIQHCAF